MPLSSRAVEVLREAEPLRGAGNEAGDKALVFPTVRGKAPDAAALSKLVRNLGISAVPHGFRSSFRDWASERTDHPREVVEAALDRRGQETRPRRPTRGRTCSSVAGT